MATLLLKKSYLINSLKEVKFKDLWGLHGVFTTIRLIDKPLKIIFLQSHLKNLINSSKTYKIYKKNLNLKLKKVLDLNLSKNKKYNHLLRLAISKNLISISIRKRLSPLNNFNLKLLNYKRINPNYKNLKYNFILKKMNAINPRACDLALIKKNKIYETGTGNLLFVRKNKLYSPKKNFYKGITLKFINKKYNINFSDINLKNLNEYSEIILIGSGKGVISINKILGENWRRKSLKYYRILSDYYKKAVTKCPTYYS